MDMSLLLRFRVVVYLTLVAMVLFASTGPGSAARLATPEPVGDPTSFNPLLHVTVPMPPGLPLMMTVARLTVNPGVRWTNDSAGVTLLALHAGEPQISVDGRGMLSHLEDESFGGTLEAKSVHNLARGEQVAIDPETRYTVAAGDDASAEFLFVELVSSNDLDPVQPPESSVPDGVTMDLIATDLILADASLPPGPLDVAVTDAHIEPGTSLSLPASAVYGLLAIESSSDLQVETGEGEQQSLTGPQALRVRPGSDSTLRNSGNEVAQVVLITIDGAFPNGATPVA